MFSSYHLLLMTYASMLRKTTANAVLCSYSLEYPPKDSISFRLLSFLKKKVQVLGITIFSACVSSFQIFNSLADVHEIFYECYAVESNRNLVLINLLQRVITTWRMHARGTLYRVLKLCIIAELRPICSFCSGMFFGKCKTNMAAVIIYFFLVLSLTTITNV